MNLQFKFLSKSDFKNKIAEYIELYKTGFTAYVDEDELMHRYFENPCGDGIVCAVEDADCELKLVACATAMPVNVSLKGKSVKAALIVNIVTHPDYRNKGIFPKMITSLEDELTLRGYEFACVFPHYTANKTFISRLGWKDIDAIPTFALEINADGGNEKALEFEINSQTLDKAPALCGEKIRFEKSAEYLNWRYPEKVYKLFGNNSGYAVIKGYKDELNILELWANDEARVQQLTARCIAFAKQNGFKRVSTFASLNSVFHKIIEKYGFVPTSPVRYFAAKRLKSSASTDIYDIKNWAISMGDHNAY